MDLNLSAVAGPILRPVGRLVATAQNGLEVLRLGGLETESVPSPFQTVETVPMYRLRRYFQVRLFEATGEGGPVTLLTDGGDIYVRTLDGRFFNLLKDPTQPLLVVGEEASFKVLASRARPRKKRARKAVPDGA